MLKCDGPPNGECPNKGKAVITKLCQGDMMLCEHCDIANFGTKKAKLDTHLDHSVNRNGASGGATGAFGFGFAKTVQFGGAKPKSRQTEGSNHVRSEACYTNTNTESSNVAVNDSKPVGFENEVIINDILCFVHNKMDKLPTDTILKLCHNHYSSETIEVAKKKLYAVLGDDVSSRCIPRKGPEKKTRNLEDIIKLYSEMTPSKLEKFYFVSQTLDLPPISFDSLDVTMLLTKIESLSDEVCLLKQGLTCQVGNQEEIKNLYKNLDKRIGTLENVPQPIVPIPNTDVNKDLTEVKQCFTSEKSATLQLVKEQADNTKLISQNAADAKPAIQDANKRMPESESWTEVVKRKNKNKSTRQSDMVSKETTVANKRPVKKLGTNLSTSLRVIQPQKVKRVANVFISRLGPEVSIVDVKKFIDSKFDVETKCVKLDSKYPDSYSSFYVSIKCDDPSVFMNADVWPQGCLYRWYKPNAKAKVEKSNVTLSNKS